MGKDTKKWLKTRLRAIREYRTMNNGNVKCKGRSLHSLSNPLEHSRVRSRFAWPLLYCQERRGKYSSSSRKRPTPKSGRNLGLSLTRMSFRKRLHGKTKDDGRLSCNSCSEEMSTMVLIPNNNKTIERMTCHRFLRPIRIDRRSSSHTTAVTRASETY